MKKKIEAYDILMVSIVLMLLLGTTLLNAAFENIHKDSKGNRIIGEETILKHVIYMDEETKLKYEIK